MGFFAPATFLDACLLGLFRGLWTSFVVYFTQTGLSAQSCTADLHSLVGKSGSSFSSWKEWIFIL
jgi:hypothetical protein